MEDNRLTWIHGRSVLYEQQDLEVELCWDPLPAPMWGSPLDQWWLGEPQGRTRATKGTAPAVHADPKLDLC